MSNKFTIAAVQMNAGNDMSANISRGTNLIRDAVGKGAKFIACPENSFFMGANREESFANADKADRIISQMQELATKLDIWLLFCVAVKAQAKLANRSILLSPKGEIVAHYDKIHLFDVNIPDGESHHESDNFIGGSKTIIADLANTKLGMTICYDLRFPQLFRSLAQTGAELISVPSAFTHKTGEAHWHVLLRARAIENGCYIIAPAQCGKHPRARETYGHSLIIDPWGKVIAEGSEAEEEVVMAEIDLGYAREIRAALPSLRHDREFK